jgi:hypothetical protein
LIWGIVFFPFWVAAFLMMPTIRHYPEYVGVSLAIVLSLSQGVWAAVWVLSIGLRQHGLTPKLLKRSFLLSGAALGASAVGMQILYIPFTPDPLGYNVLGYLVLPPIIPVAASAGGILGFIIHRVWLVADHLRTASAKKEVC